MAKTPNPYDARIADMMRKVAISKDMFASGVILASLITISISKTAWDEGYEAAIKDKGKEQG